MNKYRFLKTHFIGLLLCMNCLSTSCEPFENYRTERQLQRYYNMATLDSSYANTMLEETIFYINSSENFDHLIQFQYRDTLEALQKQLAGYWKLKGHYSKATSEFLPTILNESYNWRNERIIELLIPQGIFELKLYETDEIIACKEANWKILTIHDSDTLSQLGIDIGSFHTEDYNPKTELMIQTSCSFPSYLMYHHEKIGFGHYSSFDTTGHFDILKQVTDQELTIETIDRIKRFEKVKLWEENE